MKTLFKVHFIVVLVLNTILLAFWNLFPQQFHNVLVPVVLALGLRSLFLIIQKIKNN